MKKYILLSIWVLGFLSCKETAKTLKPLNPVKQIGINMENMDKTVRPQDDFYNYVNGEWMKRTEIPADRSRWGSFDELRKNTDKNTLKILREAQNDPAYKEGTDQRKALDYFASIMDLEAREKAGIKPVKPFLDQINGIKTKDDVLKFMVTAEPVLNSSFMGVGVSPDMKDSNKNVLYVYPAGFGLPERDYYTAQDADAQKIREQYKEHIGRMLQFLNKTESEIKTAQQHILDIETRLAKAKLTKEERRKPEKTYNPMSVQDWQQLMPDFDVKKYLQDLDLQVDSVVVTQPGYFKVLNQVFVNQPIDAIKDYLTWNVFRSAAGKLSKEISDANWQFYGKILEGQKKRRPLDERALATVNWSIGEAVGKLYVDKMFPPEAKAKAKEMITYLQKAYTKRIAELPWMSEQTKQKAIHKVNSLQIKIGYPDKWKDYGKLKITPVREGGSYFDNSMAVSQWHFDEMKEKLNKPVDKTEWGMAPQIVNAYYNPMYNEIVFPAAILQPPFYDYRVDEAVNYGGMGAVIGHEISHGFDDQGAKFNAEGNFENWWTEQDFEKFNDLVKKLAEQYNKIEVLPGVFINGEFTSGENIGDLGGVNAALTALQLYYKDHKKPGKIQGFTPEQRFFMSWATIWRTKSREEALKKQIKTDPHSPGQVRATQPLRNVDEFYQAFDIKKGDKMYIKPEERVKIW
jgi:predicted metalloendopeptidase